MAICHQRKLIFVHIPKNAGTSIHSLFDTNPRDYLPDQRWNEYKNHFKEYWDTYTTFSIIRNPISRFISFYKFCKSNSLCQSKNVNDFMEEMEVIKTPIKNTQSWFICENNTLMVDKIIRYENLKSDLYSLGIFEIPHKNKSNLPEKIFLEKSTIKKIEDFYEEDYKILN